MQKNYNDKFKQEFWIKNDGKFIIFKNFIDRNKFIEFLHEQHIPMNMFAYYNRNRPDKFEWNMLFISKNDTYLNCKHASRNDKKRKYNELSTEQLSVLFNIAYYDIYGNYSNVSMYKREK